jgi:hypothetical protein
MSTRNKISYSHSALCYSDKDSNISILIDTNKRFSIATGNNDRNGRTCIRTCS